MLRDLLAQVPPSIRRPGRTLHPPLRKALLAELGRRDPSLAYRAACHLWARDLAGWRPPAPPAGQAGRRWAAGDEWACFAVVEASRTADGWQRGGPVRPGRGARVACCCCWATSWPCLCRPDAPGLHGRAAGHARPPRRRAAPGALDDWRLPDGRADVDHDRIRRVWQRPQRRRPDVDRLRHGRPAVPPGHRPRHQPGAVPRPVPRRGGPRHHRQVRRGQEDGRRDGGPPLPASRRSTTSLSPADFSAASVERAGLVKAVAAEALGTAPGSVAYNAGQVFGGTGYSEDDILAKFYRDAAAWRFLGTPNVRRLPPARRRPARDWRPDGQRLAALPDEAELFDQLAQRKALQAELDEVRVCRSRLRGLVNDWQSDRRAGPTPARRPAPAAPSEPRGWPGRTPTCWPARPCCCGRTPGWSRGWPPRSKSPCPRLAGGRAAVAGGVRGARPRAGSSRGDRHEPARRRAGRRPARHDLRRLPGRPCPSTRATSSACRSTCRGRAVPEMVEADPALAARDREHPRPAGRLLRPARATGCPTSATSSASTAPTRRTSTSAGDTASSACRSRGSWAARAGRRSTTTC